MTMAAAPDLSELLEQLNWAIENSEKLAPEQWEIINKLPDENPELVRMADDLGQYPLHNAVYYGCEPAIRSLLGAGADVNALTEDRFRQTPLHLAARSGEPDASRLLVEAGADVTLRSAIGFTSLMQAIDSGKDAVVGRLLTLGVPMDLRVAVNLKQTEIVRVMLRDNPALVRVEPDATDLVTEATFRGNMEILRMLLEAGADPNTASVMRHSLNEAVDWNHAAVELLLQYGADPDREVRPGATTPRQYAPEWALDLFSRFPKRPPTS
jgi:ankyrin repeat protein